MARKAQCKVGEGQSEIVREIPAACVDEAKAVDFIERQRWNGSPSCPHCQGADVYTMTSRDGGREKHFRWRCRDCGKLFSARTGTVMEDSRIPLRCWCYAFWRACTSKKGVAAKEIQRQCGLSYKSALFLMHRVRFAMANGPGNDKLRGIVEADETYVGGKPRRTRTGKVTSRSGDGIGGTDKQPVFAAVERSGRVVTRVMPKVTTANLKEAIREYVDESARIITDDCKMYRGLDKEFAGGHDTINHSLRIYSVGDIHTNTVEGFFSLVKRGLHGIWHSVSRKHLHRYLAGCEFRYSNRKMEDGERTAAAIRASVGKRLTYQQQLGTTPRVQFFKPYTDQSATALD